MAPSIFPDPYCNDGVDKYNHKWVVIAVAIFTVASFVIPLHPSYLMASVSSPPQHIPPISVTHPKVKADCWCPPQFTDSYIKFTDTFCTNAFNAVLRGDNETQRVYEYRGSEHVDTDTDYKPPYFELKRQKEDRHEEIQMKRQKEDHHEDIEMNRQKEDRHAEIQQFNRRLQKMVTFQTPMLLLVSVISLLDSNMVWSFLSSCCGSFNVGRTLKAAKRANSLDPSIRKQQYDALCLSVAQAAHSSPRMTSTLYLTKKFLAIVVSLVLLILIHNNLSEVGDLEDDLNRITSPSDPRLANDEGTTASSSRDLNSTDWLEYFGDVFVCHMTIGNIQVEDFNIQCAISDSDVEGNDASPMTSTHPMPKPWICERNLIDFEKNVNSLATTVFIVLTVGNVFSLCAWLWKLLNTSSRNAVGLSRNTDMDIVFVVQMAYVTTSADVARRLAQSSIGKEEDEKASLTSSIAPIK